MSITPAALDSGEGCASQLDRERVAQLLPGVDRGDALKRAAELGEMAVDTKQITDEESAVAG